MYRASLRSGRGSLSFGSTTISGPHASIVTDEQADALRTLYGEMVVLTKDDDKQAQEERRASQEHREAEARKRQEDSKKVRGMFESEEDRKKASSAKATDVPLDKK